RACGEGSSACALAIEPGMAVADAGLSDVGASADAFGVALCVAASRAPRRYQQWRLEGCSMRKYQ
ncbi:MAG TPA: hypothetical protein VGD75_07960, partial [Bradyrhizobium sp.]